MKSIPKSAYAFTLAIGLLASAPASATSIAVSNYSFETLPAGGLPIYCGGTCAYSYDAIPGWTNSLPSGQWITGGYAGNPGAYSGSVIAFTDHGTISQDVTAAVAGSTYSLKVALLHRTDKPMTGVIQLEVAGNVVATATGIDGGPGTWNIWTALYTATVADAGDIVTILLSNDGSVGGAFDDVRLDAVATPEPTSLALLGVGMLGLGLIRTRNS